MAEPIAEMSASVPLQASFEAIFKSSPDAILVTGSDGVIRETNPAVESIFGYTPAQLIGHSVELLIPERFHLSHLRQRRAYAAEPHTRPMAAGLEIYGRKKDGTEFPADVMLSPLPMDGEQFVLAVVRDISRRKAAEAALHLSQEHFHLLVDAVRDYAIFMLDAEGRVATWNPGAERVKGYCAEEILGQHFSKFYLQEEIERGKPAHELERAAAEGRYEDEGWRVRKDGSRFWANVIITALREESGQLMGFSKVTRDFTNRKQAEDSLLVELSNAVLSKLDLRQMLTAIGASIQRLIPHDHSTIALYDDKSRQLWVQRLFPLEQPGSKTRASLSLDGTPDGWVFRNREPLLMDHIDHQRFGELAQLTATGMRSGCWVPLNSRGHVIGTLFIGSRREAAFSRNDVELLLQVASQIAGAIENAHGFRQVMELTDRLKEEKRYLEEELRTEYSFEEIVGQSSGLRTVLKQVETVAPTDATVLILGETGTGKEMIARSIHQISPRREHTFVKLNCSAIPSGLLESELFGHEKGAFTGAITQRIGRLELANLGTLFLDEIGDLPLELQPKLLRALQEKEVERLGGKKTIPVDARLLAATNRDLTKMVKSGEFRSDLYYRLRVFPITIPPLRQRSTDIPLLVEYFVAKHARRMNKQIDTIPNDTMAAFTKWQWPGNVRELENFIERAVILTPGTVLRAPLAELEALEEEEPASVDPSLQAAEREHVLRVLRESKGAIGGAGGAAEKLGLKRTTLNSKLKKLGIAKEDYM